jgi:hypothetical protein
LGQVGVNRESMMPILCSRVALAVTKYQPIRKKAPAFQCFPPWMPTLGFPLSIARVLFWLHRSIKLIQALQQRVDPALAPGEHAIRSW